MKPPELDPRHPDPGIEERTRLGVDGLAIALVLAVIGFAALIYRFGDALVGGAP